MIKGKQKSEEKVKFVLKSYETNNQWGIDILKSLLIKEGFEIINKEKEDYNVDIQAIKNDKLHRFEVEVKTNYPFTDCESFKFPSVSFLARKKKWAKEKFWYVIICRETSAFLICHSDIIYDESYKETLDIYTRDRKGSDSFYRVPKEKCTWNSLNEIKP